MCDFNHTIMDNLLNSLNNQQLSRLLRKTYLKNEIIFHENNLCEEVGVVLEGKIKIASYSYEGNEIIYNELGPQMVFGNNLVFSSDSYYRGNVIAITKAEIAYIKKDILINLMQENREFLLTYQKIQSDFGKSLNLQIKLLSLKDAKERFDYYLYINKGRISFRSVTSLADSLYLKRETVSRLIHSLEQEGKIKIHNKTIEKI